MDNDLMIIQQVYSRSNYANMLKLTMVRHLEYAMRHRMDYQAIMCNVVKNHPFQPYLGDPEVPWGGWAKIVLIREALAAGYPYVVWIDADAIIWNTQADLRDVYKEMGDASVGACQHPGPPVHLNVGVEYWRNTDRAKEFVVEWLSHIDGRYDNWLEQGVFNKMHADPQWAGIVARVNDKWNATKMAGTDVPDAIVRGYHGSINYTPLMRFQAMQADLASMV